MQTRSSDEISADINEGSFNGFPTHCFSQKVNFISQFGRDGKHLIIIFRQIYSEHSTPHFIRMAGPSFIATWCILDVLEIMKADRLPHKITIDL